MYLLWVDGNNGSMRVPPFTGGFMEQPFRTMQVFQAIQEKFWEKLAEDGKKLGGH